MKPTTQYLACLVPAFDAGRKAGLEMEVTAADQDSLRPAWESTQAQVRLPVYYHWEFSTGSGGDFESLAARLVGRPVPPGIGQRPLRVENQPYGLPDLGVVVLEGALRSTEPPPLPDLDPGFRDAAARFAQLICHSTCGDAPTLRTLAVLYRPRFQAKLSCRPGSGSSTWTRPTVCPPVSARGWCRSARSSW